MSTVLERSEQDLSSGQDRPCHRVRVDDVRLVNGEYRGIAFCGLLVMQGKPHSHEECRKAHVRCPVCFEEDLLGE